MEGIFKEAQRKREAKESMLTWSFSNVAKYGIPARATPRNIWPPLSYSKNPVVGGDAVDSQEISKEEEARRRMIAIEAQRRGISIEELRRRISMAEQLSRDHKESMLTSANTNVRRFGIPPVAQARTPPSYSKGPSVIGNTGSLAHPINPQDRFTGAQRGRNYKESVLTWGMSQLPMYGIPPNAQSGNRVLAGPTTSSSKSIEAIMETAVGNTASLEEVSSGSVDTQSEIYQEMKRLTADKRTLYHPLHDGQTIRVIELQAGKPEQSLKCDLHYVNLGNLHMEYDALSYVWGKSEYSYDANTGKSTKKKATIECNGRKRDVTRNLFRALKGIRSYTQRKFLFVDAICINQEDKDERGHQVSLMGSVYGNARKVVMWMGDGDVSTWDPIQNRPISAPVEFEAVRAQRAFGAICDIVNLWKRRTGSRAAANYFVEDLSSTGGGERFATFDPFPSTARTCEDQELMKKTLDGHYTDARLSVRRAPLNASVTEKKAAEAWMSIADLFERSWFWRVWVVQEAILARKAVARWGNVEIDWCLIGTAAAILRTNYRSLCERIRIGGIYNAYLMYRMSPLCEMPIPDLSFTDLVRLTRQLEVTDSRDRIYGLLGIRLKDNDPISGSLFIDPDYKISAANLWRKLACKSILTTGTLSILSSVQYTARFFECEAVSGTSVPWSSELDYREDKLKVPTWVPVWSKVYRTTLAAWDLDDKFSAAQDFRLQFDKAFDTTTEVLGVHGIEVGTIGYEGIYMWKDVDTSHLLSKHLGQLFASPTGLLLLSRIFTAGRNSYGTLTDSSEQALCDFAAYMLKLHEKFLADLEEAQPQERLCRLQQYEDYDRLHLKRPDGQRIREKKNFQPIFDRHPGLEEQIRALAKTGNADRFCETAVSLCERRRLFFTMNGFIGIGPDTLRRGDILAILSGGDVPFILRPWENTQIEEDTPSADQHPDMDHKYLLVGECYVEGLMKGEAVKAVDRDDNFQGPVLPDLIIRQILSEATPTGVKSLAGETGGTGKTVPAKRHAEEREHGGYKELELLSRKSPTKHVFNIL